VKLGTGIPANNFMTDPGIPEDRGCDAAWCEHCGRALCLYCLTDCGDNPKTDPTAKSSRLIGDAHDHVLNNDCGLTAGKGIAHSGKTLLKYHEQQFLRKVALRLKRVPEPIRDQICQNLAIEKEAFEQMAEASAEALKPHSLTEQRREMENEKWEAWSQDLRVNFLHSAWRGDELLTQSLLETGIPCSIPDAVTGETALHFAASKGRAKVVQILVEHGADPWQLSPPGRTPLDDLCNLQSSCDLETARLLVRACMLRAPAIYHQGKEIYPWLRPWPNGETAASSAKMHHPTSPVKDYFAALKDFSFQLATACAGGETDSVEQLLSNKTTVFPRLGTDLPHLPPAQDLIWIYNKGSGCTPLLDLCAKSFQQSSAHHTVSCAQRILKVAKTLDDDGDTSNKTIRRLLQMRDFKFLATVFHWLALDPKPMILRLAGRLLRHVGKPLSDFVDRQGHTPMDWAKKYAMKDVSLHSEERQKHIARWEAIHLASVEHMIENEVTYDQ
jgi:Ankyrin repeats (3 copies)